MQTILRNVEKLKKAKSKVVQYTEHTALSKSTDGAI